MLLFILVTAALAWMHLAIRQTERQGAGSAPAPNHAYDYIAQSIAEGSGR